jgi:hypothetical protein
MIEAMKQALGALESCGEGHITDGGNQWYDAKLVDTAIASLRQAIREHAMYEVQRLGQEIEQEPVAWMWQHDETGRVGFVDLFQVENGWQKSNPRLKLVGPLYTHPPQRTWQGLTGEMLLKAAQSSLSPEQYDHFEAMSKYQPDIYDRLAYAIRVQDE